MRTRDLSQELAAIMQLSLEVEPDPGAPEPADAECSEHAGCQPLRG